MGTRYEMWLFSTSVCAGSHLAQMNVPKLADAATTGLAEQSAHTSFPPFSKPFSRANSPATSNSERVLLASKNSPATPFHAAIPVVLLASPPLAYFCERREGEGGREREGEGQQNQKICTIFPGYLMIIISRIVHMMVFLLHFSFGFLSHRTLLLSDQHGVRTHSPSLGELIFFFHFKLCVCLRSTGECRPHLLPFRSSRARIWGVLGGFQFIQICFFLQHSRIESARSFVSRK